MKDMNPRELITNSIEQNLLEPLSEIGFAFSKSSMSFKRKVSVFTQTIHFQLNRKNYEGECAEFWTSYKVSSKEYSKWYKKEFGKEAINDSLGSAMDWNIKGWEFPIIGNKKELHFQIIDESHMDYVLDVLKHNIFTYGIPFLDNLSDWERSAHQLVTENEQFHSKACDFFLIAGKKDKALWALEQGIEYWEKNPKASFPEEKDEIKQRMAKYFGKNYS